MVKRKYECERCGAQFIAEEGKTMPPCPTCAHTITRDLGLRE